MKGKNADVENRLQSKKDLVSRDAEAALALSVKLFINWRLIQRPDIVRRTLTELDRWDRVRCRN